MSYDSDKVLAGRQRIDVIDITVEGCANTYGVAPCEASTSENLIEYSETFASMIADDATSTIVVAVPASYPPGATEAVRIEAATSPDFHDISHDAITTEGYVSFSCSFLKDSVTQVTLTAGSVYASFNLNTLAMTSVSFGTTASIVADGAWLRCTVSGVSNVDFAAMISLLPSTSIPVGNGLWASKLQLISHEAATGEYIKTTANPIKMTGSDKCFNSWATCQDQANFNPTDKVVSFSTPTTDLPDGCIPFLESVRGDSGQLDPENSLGKRGEIRVVLNDAPHDDTGIDNYVDERDYSALERGTFWPRFRARFPFYQGRLLEWYQGYHPFSRANAKKRTYIIEELKGWGRTKNIAIVARDPLKLADDKRAQWPRATTGTLSAQLLEASNPTTLDVLTDDDTEYDIDTYEPVGVINIGSECIQYTGVTPITGGVTLTGVSRGPIGQYTTTRATHNAGAAVQKCAYFYQMKVPAVFQVLLENGGNVPAAYIDYPTWEAEYDEWLGGLRVTRLIVKPEGVTSIIKELIPQSNTWALWFDNEDAEIKYQVVRPLDYDEIIETLTDEDHIIAGSILVDDDPNRLINQILVQYGQIDPTKKVDEPTNYEQGFVAIDVGSQSPREHGQTFSTTINARWHPTTNRVELTGIADRMLQARADVPVKVEFEVDRKDDAVKTAQFITLETAVIADEFGLPDPTIVRVIQQDPGGDTVKYVARQELMASGFARWAPDSIAAGTSYQQATADQKRRYLFWADNTTGLLGGTDDGKKWL